MKPIYQSLRLPGFLHSAHKTGLINGVFIKSQNNQSGFSIIEVMISIVIIGFAVGLFSVNFRSLNRIAARFNEQVVFREQYLIFLLKLEEDYQQSEIRAENDQLQLDNLTFKIDHNLDGDYLDAGELITYRWNKQEQRIDRKSGNGSFQAFLDGVNTFSWQRISTMPLCHQLKTQNKFISAVKTVDYCHPYF